MDLIMSYLMNVTLSGDKNEFKKVRYQAIRYVIMDNQLHKHRYSIPLLKCLMPKDEIMSLMKSMREYMETILEINSLTRL